MFLDLRYRAKGLYFCNIISFNDISLLILLIITPIKKIGIVCVSNRPVRIPNK